MFQTSERKYFHLSIHLEAAASVTRGGVGGGSAVRKSAVPVATLRISRSPTVTRTRRPKMAFMPLICKGKWGILDI